MVTIPVPSLRKALDFMLDVTAVGHSEALVRAVVEGLPRLVDSELTTLSICDLEAGTRRVVSYPRDAIAPGEQACFNRLIHTHPLVRYHSSHADGGAQRISDCADWPQFRRQELYSDYYRRIGIDHVVAVPVVASSGLVMSYVLNRRGRDFDDRECALLDAMRPALANLYRFSSWAGASPETEAPAGPRLTPREEEVLRWVAAGKSDKQVAITLGTSLRTVHKHLENAYAKLGVTNRTAAVMRLEGMRRRAP
ncbi:MAG: helix-turn-helix transcriptional regulator [Usitatibacter sp.]